ncbi:RNA-directed DNA polymerase, eukaryota, reverse transcriptase zinc-binding domain protein [Tanacetum coccineum]
MTVYFKRVVSVVCKVKKKQVLIFKVDFEKAYDSVRWDFLDEVLCKFGFGDKWRRWIQCCLHSSRGSIIINGSPTEEFKFGKGLKQGDPLSLFLFILIMESLHLSFQRVVDEGLFQGLRRRSLDVWCLNLLLLISDLWWVGICIDYNLGSDDVDSSQEGLLNGDDDCCRFGRTITWLELRFSDLMLYFIVCSIKSSFRFISQGSSLWARVIKTVHGADGNIGMVRKVGVKSCWANIVNEINVLSNKGVNLMKYLRIRLGNGDSTLLWDDPWHVGGILKDRFPRVYALETFKCLVTGCFPGEGWRIRYHSSFAGMPSGGNYLLFGSLTCDLRSKLVLDKSFGWDVSGPGDDF